MNTTFQKIAAVLALVIGAMAFFSGGQVLLGKAKDYYVIDWVPVYNFVMGTITVIITTALIWKNHRYALPAAIATFSAHATVMLILQIFYQGIVAPDSIRAMTLRLSTWTIILAFMLIQSWKNKAVTA